MNILQSNSTHGVTQQHTSTAGIPTESITETPPQTQTTSPIQQQVIVPKTRKRWGITDALTLFLRLLFGFIAFSCFHGILHETFSRLFGFIDIVLEVCMAFCVALSAKETAAKAARWLVSNRYLILISVLSVAMAAGGVRWTELMLAQANLPPLIAPFDWCIHTLSIILVLVVSIYSAQGLVLLLRKHVFERQPRR